MKCPKCGSENTRRPNVRETECNACGYRADWSLFVPEIPPRVQGECVKVGDVLNSVVWKYELQPSHNGKPFAIPLPAGSRVLRAGAINEKLFVWVQVPAGEQLHEEYQFKVVPTGLRFDDGPWKFLDTVLMPMQNGGTLVWHVYYGVYDASVRRDAAQKEYERLQGEQARAVAAREAVRYGRAKVMVWIVTRNSGTCCDGDNNTILGVCSSKTEANERIKELVAAHEPGVDGRDADYDSHGFELDAEMKA